MTNAKRLFSLFLLVIGWIICSEGLAEVTARHADGHPNKLLSSIEIKGSVYVSANDLAEYLGASQYWQPYTKKMILRTEGHRLKLTAFSSLVEIDHRSVNLPLEVVWRRGVLYLPMAPLVDVVDLLVQEDVIWDETARTLDLRPSSVNITDLKIVTKENGTLILISLDEPLDFRVNLDEGSRTLLLDIPGGRLKKKQIEATSPRGAVVGISAWQTETSAQIDFRLDKSIRYHRSSLEEDPPRLLISLWERAGDMVLSPDPIDVVVIDPGHGGKDPGAIGPCGVKEKDVVLSICQRLAALVSERMGIKVIMTRDDDTFVTLDQRSTMANQQGADLFISVHANASKRQQSRGFETYFLGYSEDDQSRAVEALENSAVRFERPTGPVDRVEDVDFILWDMIQNEYHQESADFAEIVRGNLQRKLHLPAREVKQAGFIVLNGAFMPAVLVETAFISNPQEEKLLQQPWFQQKVAESICDSISEFRRKYEGMN